MPEESPSAPLHNIPLFTFSTFLRYFLILPFFFCIYFHHFELHEAGLACLHIQIPLIWAIHLVLEVKLYMDSFIHETRAALVVRKTRATHTTSTTNHYL